MFWIEEGSNDKLRGYRLYYCETESDISVLPTTTDAGTQEPLEDVINTPCTKGCEALVIQTGEVYTLTPTSGWVKLGG